MQNNIQDSVGVWCRYMGNNVNARMEKDMGMLRCMFGVTKKDKI